MVKLFLIFVLKQIKFHKKNFVENHLIKINTEIHKQCI